MVVPTETTCWTSSTGCVCRRSSSPTQSSKTRRHTSVRFWRRSRRWRIKWSSCPRPRGSGCVLGFDVDSRKVTTIPHGATVPSGPALKRPSQTHPLDVGTVGPWEGCRAGDRVDDFVEGSARPARVSDRRPDAPEGPCRGWRGISRCPKGASAPQRRRRFGDLRRPLLEMSKLPALIQSASVVVLPYDSTQPGHLWCSGRRDRMWPARCGYRVSARRRAPRYRSRHRRRSRRSGCHGDCPAPSADAAASGRFHGRGGPSIGAGDGVAGGGESVYESGGQAPRRPAGAGMTAATPPANFDHLLRLTDRRGTFEHACFAEPRPEDGYCTDDMARVLVVATREPDADGPVNGLAGLAIRFLNEAQAYSGACRNRMDRNGRWTDEPTTDDHWGRCIWGLGTAAAHSRGGHRSKVGGDAVRPCRADEVDIAACDGLRRSGIRRASLRRPGARGGSQG